MEEDKKFMAAHLDERRKRREPATAVAAWTNDGKIGIELKSFKKASHGKKKKKHESVKTVRAVSTDVKYLAEVAPTPHKSAQKQPVLIEWIAAVRDQRVVKKKREATQIDTLSAAD